MADRMTPEQVAELRLPEGCEWFGGAQDAWRVNITGTGERNRELLAMGVVLELTANGQLPPVVLDWVWANVDGSPVPTPEQWEAAQMLASWCRANGETHASIDIISPPPPPAPVIAPCPYCGGACAVFGQRVECRCQLTERSRRCCYMGPTRDTSAAAIAAHNDVAGRLKVEEPKPRTCGGCRHWHKSDHCASCRYVGGQKIVLSRAASPTRDASECERWEPRS